MSRKTTIGSLIAATAIAAAIALPATFAGASSELDGAVLGKTESEITASLTTKGYEVRKIEDEDGRLEAYALKDGKKFEVYVDVTTGTVIKVKFED